MTKKEASQKYGIPLEILDEYESWGLCHTVKEVMGVWQYDEIDIERLSMIMTLHDVGFSNEEIGDYIQMMIKGEKPRADFFKMLNLKRNKTLDEIHFYEKRLDRLDYLRHEMKRKQGDK